MRRAAAVMVFDKNRAEEKDPSESISFVCFMGWLCWLISYCFTMIFMPYYRNRKSKSIIFLNFCWAGSDFDATNAKTAGPAQRAATEQGRNHPEARCTEAIAKRRIELWGAYSPSWKFRGVLPCPACSVEEMWPPATPSDMKPSTLLVTFRGARRDLLLAQ